MNCAASNRKKQARRLPPGGAEQVECKRRSPRLRDSTQELVAASESLLVAPLMMSIASSRQWATRRWRQTRSAGTPSANTRAALHRACVIERAAPAFVGDSAHGIRARSSAPLRSGTSSEDDVVKRAARAAEIRFRVDPSVPAAKAVRRLHRTEAEFEKKEGGAVGEGIPETRPCNRDVRPRQDRPMDGRTRRLDKRTSVARCSGRSA
jgi:hypothetical protein